MVYSVRRINWNLMVNPVSEGLHTEAAANAQLGKTIAGAGADIGQGFKDKRTEAESKRRFNETLSLHREELQLKRDTLLEHERERQANHTATLDGLTATMDLLQQPTPSGQPDPGVADAFKGFVDAAGGPEAAQQKLAERIPYGQKHTNQYGEPTTSLPDSPPVGYNGPRSPGAEAAFVNQGVSLRPGAATAVAPQLSPPGELNIHDLSSVELTQRAEAAAAQRDFAKVAMDQARRALDPRGLTSEADRAKAKAAYNTAHLKWTAAIEQHAMWTRRAAQAGQRETKDNAFQTKLAEIEATAKAKMAENEAQRPARIEAMRAAGFLKRDPVNAVDADALWAQYTSQVKSEGTAQGRSNVKEQDAMEEEARLRASYKAATGKDAPEGVDVKELRKWEVQNEAAAAVKADREASAKIRQDTLAETERHHRVEEQLKALGNNPNKDKLKELSEAAARHLANAKEYGNYESAVGDTKKAKDEIELARQAMAQFDELAKQSGMAGTAPEYPSWLPEGGKADWDKLSPEAKAKVIKAKGQ